MIKVANRGLILLILILSLLVVVPCLCLGGSDQSVVNNRSLKLSTISAGYWNDNMDYEQYFEGLKYGLDDYVTASFWLKGFWGSGWEADLLLNVITNRSGGYRTDLLTGRVSKTLFVSSGRWKIGLGITGSGNFGGRGIQNGYHRTRGILELELPYSFGTETGGYLGAEYFHHEWQYLNLGLQMFGGGYVCPGIGIGSIREGSILEYNGFKVWRVEIHPSAIVYHKTFFVSGEPFKPIFRSGVSYGGMVSVKVTDNFGLSLWTISNMYRNDQGQIGVAFVFGGGDQGRDDYGMMMFP